VLGQHGITLVINCAALHVPNYFEGAAASPIKYRALNMYDTKDNTEDVQWFLYEVLGAIEAERTSGGKVLVHCVQGVSRSCSFAVAYLMWSASLSYRAAFDLVKSKRPVASPNVAFTCNLVEWAKLRAALGARPHPATLTVASEASDAPPPPPPLPSTPGTGRRVFFGNSAGSSSQPPSVQTSVGGVCMCYRIAAHGAHDPSTMVPKICRPPRATDYAALAAPSLSLLDPRGVFVVLLPAVPGAAPGGDDEAPRCFIWVGGRAPGAALEVAVRFLRDGLGNLEGLPWATAAATAATYTDGGGTVEWAGRESASFLEAMTCAGGAESGSFEGADWQYSDLLLGLESPTPAEREEAAAAVSAEVARLEASKAQDQAMGGGADERSDATPSRLLGAGLGSLGEDHNDDDIDEEDDGDGDDDDDDHDFGGGSDAFGAEAEYLGSQGPAVPGGLRLSGDDPALVVPGFKLAFPGTTQVPQLSSGGYSVGPPAPAPSPRIPPLRMLPPGPPLNAPRISRANEEDSGAAPSRAYPLEGRPRLFVLVADESGGEDSGASDGSGVCSPGGFHGGSLGVSWDEAGDFEDLDLIPEGLAVLLGGSRAFVWVGARFASDAVQEPHGEAAGRAADEAARVGSTPLAELPEALAGLVSLKGELRGHLDRAGALEWRIEADGNESSDFWKMFNFGDDDDDDEEEEQPQHP